jgi:hypothetical protein
MLFIIRTKYSFIVKPFDESSERMLFDNGSIGPLLRIVAFVGFLSYKLSTTPLLTLCAEFLVILYVNAKQLLGSIKNINSSPSVAK